MAPRVLIGAGPGDTFVLSFPTFYRRWRSGRVGGGRRWSVAVGGRGYNPRVSDPFETAAIRARVLQAWAASPVRFREDANLEEDLVLGGYRDRVVVELAQNAADAALRAGVPGRLRLTLAGTTLTAANTGAPLDAGGVTGLSTLRASAKIDEVVSGSGPDSEPGSAAGAEAAPVGRFGVGFAAVLAV